MELALRANPDLKLTAFFTRRDPAALKTLTPEQKKLLEEFESSTADKQYQKRKSFFDKLKDIFN